MLLTIETTAPEQNGDGANGSDPAAAPIPATDLGFVLYKHPENVRTVDTTAGPGHVFWTEAGPERAEVALLVDVDSIGLVRRDSGAPLAAYVNDRGYVASSFLSVAIGRLFRSAINGTCESRPELVDVAWPFVVRLPAVPIGPDRGIVHRLFGPLGYEVAVAVPDLDPTLPTWGPAAVASVELRATLTARDLLRHLYVLLPVLDDDKHYWIDRTEVEKLLRHGDGWLAGHPEHELIARRSLRHSRALTREVLDRLMMDDGFETAGPNDEVDDAAEASIERPLSLNDQRLTAVTNAVLAEQPDSVVDLGCGEGRLLARLADEPSIDRLVGVDVSVTSLERAKRRLRLDRRPERQRPTVELRQSALTYRDRELIGFDVACLVEVVEHLDPPRLDALEPILFANLRPRTVIVTTPNREYNAVFDLPAGRLRHRDHRFEWTRAEFEAWCDRMAHTNGYRYEIMPIGPIDDRLGPPTQMARFTRSRTGRVDG